MIIAVFKEQTIQDYYIYETWIVKDNTGKDIEVTFSYSDMEMLRTTEQSEDFGVTREFIIHPNGVVSGSWSRNDKILLL